MPIARLHMLGETMTTTEESVVREVHHLEKGADNSKVEKLIFVNLLIFLMKLHQAVGFPRI